MWHSAEGIGWWMVWGAIMMVLFWGVLIALVVWLVQSLASGGAAARGREPSAGPAPLDIAKERYARGEIGREEFEQIKKDLEGH